MTYAPPGNEAIIGSSVSLEYKDGKLIRGKTLGSTIDDGPGKPVGINEFIGRRPIAAFGNSDGDLEMLQWTTMSGGVLLGTKTPYH